MSKDSKVPPPDIKPPAPQTPPVTTVGMGKEGKVEPTISEQKSADETSNSKVTSHEDTSNEVEVDMMKRFLGALIDGLVIAGISSFMPGNSIPLLVSIALWLTRDSLPFLNGQSLGKIVMKTQALKKDGSSLSGDWQTGATRNILFILPLLGAIVEGITLITRQEKPKAGLRLGDEWAKTKVVSIA